MTFKTACHISIVLSIGSMFFVFPGNLLFYYPIFSQSPAMAIHLIFTRFAPYFIFGSMSILGYVTLLFSMLFRIKDSRSAACGLIAATVLTAVAALGLVALSISYVIESKLPPLVLLVYAASAIICFINGLVLCLFILMFLRNTLGAMWPALLRIAVTILYCIATIGSFVVFVTASPEEIIYMVTYTVTYFGIFMAIAADLLVMTAYIGYVRRHRPSSAPLNAAPCQTV